MLMVQGNLRVGLLTDHIPVSEVASIDRRSDYRKNWNSKKVINSVLVLINLRLLFLD
jgi:hypothetical protein